jgi:predicted AAA+ superfamily ATPase
MFTRPTYIDHIRNWTNRPLIKVFTGMRRSGKSVLLRQAAETLVASGFSPSNVHLFDMERLENDPYRSAEALNRALHERDQTDGSSRRAVLIDEVQAIDGWERLAPSLLNQGWDVWLTGSNADLLSSDLATHLTGRYVEIPVWPLGWAEFQRFSTADEQTAWEAFLRWGGLPGLAALGWQHELARPYLESVFDSILLKDVVARFGVRNVPLLQRLARFVAESVGTPVSPSSIARYCKSQRLNVTVDTVQSYLDHLAAAFLVHAVPRWDVKAKRHLETGAKYYLGDTGLFTALLGRPAAPNALLENLVYLELRRRGYRVACGRTAQAGRDDLEVDFVAERGDERVYVQVAYLLNHPDTVDRETRSLLSIPDHYPKWIVHLDPLPPPLPDGLRTVNARTFMDGSPIS